MGPRVLRRSLRPEGAKLPPALPPRAAALTAAPLPRPPPRTARAQSNGIAIGFYEGLGYTCYRRVLGYYSGDEDAHDMRKPLSRDVDGKSAVPLEHPVHPDDVEFT